MKRLKDAEIGDICNKRVFTTYERGAACRNRQTHRSWPTCKTTNKPKSQYNWEFKDNEVPPLAEKLLANVAGWDKKSQYVVVFELNFNK